MSDLILCTLQLDLVWENPQANREKTERLLQQVGKDVDLIVLPEMFTTGFSMDAPRIAEKHDYSTMESLRWMKKTAKTKGAVITGSIAVEDGGEYFNRLYWVEPSGKFSFYDKHHLFAFAGEDKHYTAGKNKIIVEIKGWKILPLICFDLRFPEWSRNKLVENSPQYDLLLYVANWPERRSEHWKKLLLARAIENQCYMAGVNRVGKDDNGIRYRGDSAIIDYLGKYVLSHPEFEESIKVATLNKSSLVKYRKVFPVLR